jgi:hypothetical protein
VPALGISAIDDIEVPQVDMAAFAILITPTRRFPHAIDDRIYYHVADVFIQHQDGTTTTLIVRHTGHNPAAISLDDCNYYYAGSDAFPDGAIRIVQLLNDYQHRSRK